MLSLMDFVIPGSGDWGAGEGSLNISWSRTDLDDLRVLRESERERPPERNDLSDLLVDREREVLPRESKSYLLVNNDSQKGCLTEERPEELTNAAHTKFAR